MQGNLKDLTVNLDGTQNITITIDSDFREAYDKLKENKIEVEIKKASKHRSMDANNYLWLLCGEIAKASSKYSNDGKNDVYREAIQAKGEFDPVLVREDAVDTFISNWSKKGTGWFAEVIDDYKEEQTFFDMGDTPDRYKIVHVYYGSSIYDTQSMSRVIDYVVNIANDLGIPTMTPGELAKTMSLWQKKVGS